VTLSAVVFDFDGVIANSEPLHLRAYQDVLAAQGVTLSADEYYARYLGFDDAAVFRQLAADRGWAVGERELSGLVEALIHAKDIAFAHLAESGGLFPGAVDCVRRLAADVPLAIASGARREEIEHVLEKAGLRDYFPVIVAAGETPRSKPDPDPYARAVELLREHGAIRGPRSCAAVEDSHWGIRSAKSAGLTCVAVTHTYRAADLATADLVVETLGELTTERLRRLTPDES
jgi:beta-phosphoglucomutase